MENLIRQDQLPLPIDIIFSCAICQASVTEIYQAQEVDKSLHNALEQDFAQQITKLWLTDCRHLICGRHLDGGGPPFHQSGERPRAACPLCSHYKNDSEWKNLYSIRVCQDGTFESDIPKSWFNTPPIRLDGATDGIDAMGFHYLSLLQFGTVTKVRLKRLSGTLRDTREALERQTALHQQEFSKAEQLQVRVAYLENCEKRLEHWKKREAEVKYYLGVLSEVMDDNRQLREILASMDYSVAQKEYSYKYHVASRGLNTEAQSRERELEPIFTEQRDYDDRLASNDINLPAQASGLERSIVGEPRRFSPSRDRLATQGHRSKSTIVGGPSQYLRQDRAPKKLHSPAIARRRSMDLMPPPPHPVSKATRRNGRGSGRVGHPAESLLQSPTAERIARGEKVLEAGLNYSEDHHFVTGGSNHHSISGSARPCGPFTARDENPHEVPGIANGEAWNRSGSKWQDLHQERCLRQWRFNNEPNRDHQLDVREAQKKQSHGLFSVLQSNNLLKRSRSLHLGPRRQDEPLQDRQKHNEEIFRVARTSTNAEPEHQSAQFQTPRTQRSHERWIEPVTSPFFSKRAGTVQHSGRLAPVPIAGERVLQSTSGVETGPPRGRIFNVPRSNYSEDRLFKGLNGRPASSSSQDRGSLSGQRVIGEPSLGAGRSFARHTGSIGGRLSLQELVAQREGRDSASRTGGVFRRAVRR